MPMPPEELRKVTAHEICLMRDAAEGLTNAEIALRRGKTEKAVEKSFERLRDKLRDWGGGSKPGLVHWVDVYYDARLRAMGLDDRTDEQPTAGRKNPAAGQISPRQKQCSRLSLTLVALRGESEV